MIKQKLEKEMKEAYEILKALGDYDLKKLTGRYGLQCQD